MSQKIPQSSDFAKKHTLWKGPFEYDKQDSIESDAIAIAKPDDELVVGNNEVNSVDDGFVEVIDGEIEDGTSTG